MWEFHNEFMIVSNKITLSSTGIQAKLSFALKNTVAGRHFSPTPLHHWLQFYNLRNLYYRFFPSRDPNWVWEEVATRFLKFCNICPPNDNLLLTAKNVSVEAEVGDG